MKILFNRMKGLLRMPWFIPDKRITPYAEFDIPVSVHTLGKALSVQACITCKTGLHLTILKM